MCLDLLCFFPVAVLLSLQGYGVNPTARIAAVYPVCLGACTSPRKSREIVEGGGEEILEGITYHDRLLLEFVLFSLEMKT